MIAGEFIVGIIYGNGLILKGYVIAVVVICFICMWVFCKKKENQTDEIVKGLASANKEEATDGRP